MRCAACMLGNRFTPAGTDSLIVAGFGFLPHDSCREIAKTETLGVVVLQTDQYVDNNRSTRVNAANILHALPPHLKAIVQVIRRLLTPVACYHLLLRGVDVGRHVNVYPAMRDHSIVNMSWNNTTAHSAGQDVPATCGPPGRRQCERWAMLLAPSQL